MRKKKPIAKIGALCMMLAVLFSTTAFAAEQSAKIITKVPDTHTVRLEIGEHGSVTVGKEIYTGTQEMQVERLAEEFYTIKAEGKYEIETVTYDGADVTEQLHEKTYQAPPVNKDGIVLKVTFNKKENIGKPAAGQPGSGGKTSATMTGGARTGDETPVEILLLLIAGAVIVMTTGIAFRCKKNRK